MNMRITASDFNIMQAIKVSLQYFKSNICFWENDFGILRRILLQSSAKNIQLKETSARPFSLSAKTFRNHRHIAP